MFGFNPWVLLGIGLAILSGWAAFAWERNELQDLRIAVEQQKTEAANMLAAAEAKTAAVERERDAIKDKWEKEHEQNQANIVAQSDENRRLADQLDGALGRMRVVGSGPGGRGVVPSNSGSSARCADLQAANDKLSAAVERLVAGGNDLARRADGEADIAGTCSGWAMNLQGAGR